MKKLLDINDLSKYLKLKKQTLYNWLCQKKLPGIKVGGVWRFNKKDIDLWLKTQTKKAKK